MQPGLEMRYFVLKPRSKFVGDIHAEASRKAMLTYANMIQNVNELFASDILDWVRQEEALTLAMKKASAT